MCNHRSFLWYVLVISDLSATCLMHPKEPDFRCLMIKLTRYTKSWITFSFFIDLSDTYLIFALIKTAKLVQTLVLFKR